MRHSLLLCAIAALMMAVAQEEPFMPMKEDKLSDQQIAAMAKWVDLDAPYDKPLEPTRAEDESSTVTPQDRTFWSFVRLAKPTVPVVSDSNWCRTNVDRFIFRRLEDVGITPNPMADRRVLVRRAIGLPPNPTETQRLSATTDRWLTRG